MTTLVMGAILLFGFFCYYALPVSDLPNIDYPTITVNAYSPGASPEYQASLIATPLERQFASISNLRTVTSTNTVGNSQIVLNFDLKADLDAKELEVQQSVNQSLSELPPLPTHPVYKRTNPADTPILFLSLTSHSHPLSDLYEIGYNLLAQPISMIDGVSQVQVYGFPYAVRIQADPMKMVSHRVDFNELAHSIIKSNPNLPSGTLKGRYHDVVLQTEGQIAEGEHYEEVVIREVKGIPLFVGTVAQGISSLDQRDPYFRYVSKEGEEKNTIVLAVSRLPGSNTLNISKEIQNELPILEKGIPGSVKLEVFYDKAVEIKSVIKDVEITLFIALFLVVLVIFIYLGKLLETIIPSLVLPLSLLATCIVIYLLGFNLDTLSLLALILAIGFIVDDSIVVMENIVRHVEMGKKPFEAALDGSKQISLTVLTMSIALAAVFIPFIWMPGILGRVFHEFSVTIVVAILCSGFISLTLNPMLCSRYLVPYTPNQHLSFSERMNARFVKKYEWLLHHSILYRKTTLLIGIACILLTALLFMLLPFDFIPIGNLSMVKGLVQCNQGSSRINTIEHLQKVNALLLNSPYQNGFLAMGGYPTDDQSVIFMRLAHPSKRPQTPEIAHSLYEDCHQIVGVNSFFKPFPLMNLQVGSNAGLGAYQYTLLSTQPETLYASAEELIEKMRHLPEFTQVNSNMRNKSPQLNISIDRDRAGIYNITAEAIESTLRYAYSGGRIGTFHKGINLYDLILEAEPGFDLTHKDIDLLYIQTPKKEFVPLTSLAQWKEVVGPASINHFNTFPAVTISFNLAKRVPLGSALKKLDRLAQETLPQGVIGNVQGSAEVFVETFKTMGWLLAVALLVIYLLLGILYESFIHPLTILSALPVALLGGLLTLWLFQEPISLYSFVGLIVLVGLVQKNGIMMIDFALELMRLGKTPLDAIFEASKERFRPILMTTIAAMAGALPIAIGIGENGEVNQPLGLVVVGGLIFSQAITLFFTPVVFLYMHDFHIHLKRIKK